MSSRKRLLFARKLLSVFLLTVCLFSVAAPLSAPVLATQSGAKWQKWTQSDGGTYEGYADARGYPSGFGIQLYASGDSYYGMWKDGKRDGYGLYLGGETRNYYQQFGVWQDNELHGYGDILYRDYTNISGTYQQGSPVSGRSHTFENIDRYSDYYTDLKLSDGSYFTGFYISKTSAQGPGVGLLKYPDGSLYIGSTFNFEPSIRASGDFGIFVSADHAVTISDGSQSTQAATGGGTTTPYFASGSSSSTQQVWEDCRFCGGSRGRNCMTCGGTGWVKVEYMGTAKDGKRVYESVRCANYSCSNGWIKCTYCSGDGGRWVWK